MTKGTYKTRPLLGGSWLVISGVISKVSIVITHIRGLIALLITTHEPPSTLPACSWGPSAPLGAPEEAHSPGRSSEGWGLGFRVRALGDLRV